MDGLQAILRGEHRHFDARALGQVVDQPEVSHIAVELEERVVAQDGVEDVGGVLLAPLELRLLLEPGFDLALPGGLALSVLVQNVGVDARIPAGAVGAILLDEVRALSEPGVVFAIVAGGFGGVIAQREVHLVAHDFLVVDGFLFGNGLQDHRVGVLALPEELRVERLVVDARAGVTDVLHVRADPLGQHRRGALHAVAQAAGDEMGKLALHGAAQHRHGVGVVQEHRLRAEPLDVPRDRQDGVHGAQEAEDAAGAAGIAYVGIHAVLLRDQDVVLPHVDVPGEDGADHAVRALERLFPVHRRRGAGRIVACSNDPVHGGFDVGKPLGVDVHQAQLAVLKRGEAEDVTDQATGKAKAARADECEFPSHFLLLAGGATPWCR